MAQLNFILVQLIVVLAAARLVGALFRRIGQAEVVGEMAAGLLLGPTFLGHFFPAVYSFCFPADRTQMLQGLARLGVWIFVFLVGLELDLSALRRIGRAAVLTSNTSVLLPFLCGMGCAYLVYPQLSLPGVPFYAFALFIGMAMSITAFPVLARILKERGLTSSDTGVMAIACAAVDDVTAWCLLAFIMLIVQPQKALMPVWLEYLLLAAYILFMFSLLRPLLAWLQSKYAGNKLTPGAFSLILILLFASCSVTQLVGVHALFGAFLFGVILPKPEWLLKDLSSRLEPITSVLLLPLFFAVTGLRTDLTLLTSPAMWGYCALVIAAAVLGKFAGALLPLRLTGSSWRQAAAVATLLNTRGLMELVVLSLGLELGILSPAMYSIMVLMAVVTTFMTNPLLSALLPASRIPIAAAAIPQRSY